MRIIIVLLRRFTSEARRLRGVAARIASPVEPMSAMGRSQTAAMAVLRSDQGSIVNWPNPKDVTGPDADTDLISAVCANPVYCFVTDHDIGATLPDASLDTVFVSPSFTLSM